MLSTIALLAAIAFVGVAAYRFSPSAPPRLRNAQLALALAAGLFGIAAFKATGDSRWLVGGILMVGAGVPGFLAGNRRTLATVALICGVLGVVLFGIATARPMAAAAVSPAAT
ncbi:hypothetical protein ACFSC3_08590 [Sphingomonas floccifaciens]|uniref:Uncharacterized protein n=1 Tax=Sphingomonas floccifaciens TaxID=1844115 RepID=A0ABW4NCC2_9SPHN